MQSVRFLSSFSTSLALAALFSFAACSAPIKSVPKSAVSTPPVQTCPAKDLQYLVGQPRTVLFTMRFGSEVRFEEPGQAYTTEFKASRTRIIIGRDNKIRRIVCG